MLKFIVDGKEIDIEKDSKEMSEKEIKELEDKINNSGSNIGFKIEG